MKIIRLRSLYRLGQRVLCTPVVVQLSVFLSVVINLSMIIIMTHPKLLGATKYRLLILMKILISIHRYYYGKNINYTYIIVFFRREDRA